MNMAEENADQNREKAGRQRQIMKLTHVHWRGSEILANTLFWRTASFHDDAPHGKPR
jgi:hypothetical protein